MGNLLIGAGALMVIGAILYVVIRVVWWTVCWAAAFVHLIFNFIYQMIFVKPSLEADGYLAQRHEEDRIEADAKAMAKIAAMAEKQAQPQPQDLVRDRLNKTYPMANTELIEQYMTAYATQPLSVCDKIEEQIAASHIANTSLQQSEFDYETSRNLGDHYYRDLKITLKRDNNNNCIMRVALSKDDNVNFEIGMKLDAAYYALAALHEGKYQDLDIKTARMILSRMPYEYEQIKTQIA